MGIDGVVWEVISEREKVVIRGIIPKPAPFAGTSDSHEAILLPNHWVMTSTPLKPTEFCSAMADEHMIVI